VQVLKFDKTVNEMVFKILVKKHKDGTTAIVIDNITKDTHNKTMYQLSQIEAEDLIKFLGSQNEP